MTNSRRIAFLGVMLIVIGFWTFFAVGMGLSMPAGLTGGVVLGVVGLLLQVVSLVWETFE